MAGEASSIVTVLFTDQVESTRLSQRIGDDDAADVLRASHFALLREVIAQTRGDEIKTIGDGVMVVFSSALDALACGVAIQQTVERHNRSRTDGLTFSVRVGMDAGEPIRRERDYFGTCVVVARRLCDAADGGQILVSDLVRRLAGTRGGHVFRDVGGLELKGITEPVPAHDLAWPPPTDLVEGESAEGILAPTLAQWLGVQMKTPLVGREQELARLRACWSEAKSGNRQLVLVEGSGGIGKTRLGAELARVADADGAIVVGGRGEGRELDGYPAFCEALANLATDASEVGQIAADARDVLGSAPISGAKQAFDEVAAAFLAASCRRPMVLMLDDLHLVMASEVALLRHVLRALERSPAMVICSYRTPLPRGRALAGALADFRRQGVCEHIILEGLDRDAVGSLIRAWSGHASPLRFTRAIHERTDGNPLFIEEVLRHLAETDAIYEANGEIASTRDVEEMEIPASVLALIEQRLSLLSDECHRLLHVGSVIGVEFDVASLARASQVPPDRLAELLDEALAAGTIAESCDADDRYRFTHGLVRETLYNGLSSTHRQRLHRQALRYANGDGAQIAYEVLGSAGPYLLVTGLTNCPDARVRSRTATSRWERVSRMARVVLYDRRGVGSSDAPEKGYSLRESVEDVRAVLDAVGARRVLLWGATDGGPLAIAAAALAPDRIAGLILVSTTARLINGPGWELGINPRALESYARAESMDLGGAVSQLTQVRRTGEAESRTIARLMRQMDARVWGKIRSMIITSDVRDLLSRVQVPTLILHDPGNEYIPFEAARYLREHIRGSRLEASDELVLPLYGDALYESIERFIHEVTAAAQIDPPTVG